MTGMNIQERYDDIVKISGYSENVVRQVLKATRQSILNSLCDGERSTVPGICTLTPVVRYGLSVGAQTVTAVRIKASASNSLENDIIKSNNNSGKNTADIIEKSEENEAIKLLNFAGSQSSEDIRPTERILTKQISALL